MSDQLILSQQTQKKGRSGGQRDSLFIKKASGQLDISATSFRKVSTCSEEEREGF